MSIEKFILGTTKKFTWISSGDTPSAITLRVYNGSETLVGSMAGVSRRKNFWTFRKRDY